MHKLRRDAAEVFSHTVVIEPDNSDAHPLAKAQREPTGPLILKGDAGMTGPTCRSYASLRSGWRRSSRIWNLIIDPTFNARKQPAKRLVAHGSCSNVCPAKINIHEQIRGGACSCSGMSCRWRR